MPSKKWGVTAAFKGSSVIADEGGRSCCRFSPASHDSFPLGGSPLFAPSRLDDYIIVGELLLALTDIPLRRTFILTATMPRRDTICRQISVW
jgi:hypothetical protein